ncbi:MAG: GYD domain-containing protein [Chloroflexi bacterium]|nr:GYD domain-containing protein [Chloroflexota bacterium]
MSKYLFQLAYTGDAWTAQVKNPQSALNRATTVIESLSGKIESLYYAFGEYDLIIITDMPSDVNAAAVSLAVSAGGAVKSMQTTPLMEVDEGLAAMRAAATATYSPPSA